jgi:hypothetical protein
MRQQLTLLLFPALLFGIVNTGYSQCSPNLAGLTGLAVFSVSDTGVTFNWTSVAPGQSYNLMVTTDSAYYGSLVPGYVYYSNYTTDTFASQTPLQPGTKYWIFVVNGACTELDSISFTTLPWNCLNHILQPGNLSAAQPCSSVASFGMTSTSVYQLYTFLQNGQPIPGYVNLPGPPPGDNPLTYVLPRGEGSVGTYQVVTSFVNCPGGPVDTGNSQYWAGTAPVPVPTVQSSTGSYTVCGNSDLLLTSSSGTGNVWLFNGTPLDSTGASLTVTQGGNYSVVVTNAAGCSDTSLVTVVTADPGPPTPVILASGSTTICTGGSVTLTSSSSTGDQWYDGNTALPGMTGFDYLVSQAGQYWVQVTDAYGCFVNSAIVVVQVNNDTAGQSVVPTLTPVGQLVSCSDSAVLLTASSAVNYQWFWDGDAIPGGNGDTLTVTMSGTYTVATGTAGCGTVGTLSSDSVVVTYLDQVVPTITLVNGVLVSSAPSGNQWYLNDSTIEGATHQQYTPPGPGSYTVRVGFGVQTVDTSTFQIGVGGCYSQYSLAYLITDSIDIIPQVSVYPNPVVDVLTLSNKLAGPVTVRIFNLMGQQVFQEQGITGTVQVDAGRWRKGAYFVQVIDQRTQQEEKVVVLRL